MVRSEGTVHVLQGVLDKDVLERQVNEFNEMKDANTSQVNKILPVKSNPNIQDLTSVKMKTTQRRKSLKIKIYCQV